MATQRAGTCTAGGHKPAQLQYRGPTERAGHYICKISDQSSDLQKPAEQTTANKSTEAHIQANGEEKPLRPPCSS